MSTVKYTYFDVRGIGELIRYLLKYGKINFEDNRISFEDWPKLKPSTPFGQLPLYEEDGLLQYQSTAIARYLAKKVNLTGKTEWENLEIDALVDTVNDLRIKGATYFFASNPDLKEHLRAPFMEAIPFYMDRLEAIAKKNSGYLALGRLTWADFAFATMSDLINYFSGMDVLENRPNLQAVKNKVENLPAIKDWIKKRPTTDF